MFDFERIPMCHDAYRAASAEEVTGFLRLGHDLASRCQGTEHPYILATKDTFESIRRACAENTAFHALCDQLIANADDILQKSEYRMTETCDDFVTPLRNPHADGYDVGGRLGISHTHAMVPLALAYHITKDERYARCAYFIGRDMARWEHWGPGHFLNTAEETYYAAVAYDWLYRPWQAMGLDPAAVREGIYKNGLAAGYDSVILDTCQYPSARQGTGWRFKNKPDNWNAVCNSGMIVGALALLGEREALGDERYDKLLTLLGGSLTSLTEEELVLHQYIPDGSYVESNSYWAYGTGALLRTLAVLHVAFGSDFGIHTSRGLDKTCYYAINTESADYIGWNYHDGSLSAQDTSLFFPFATVSGDRALLALRLEHLRRGKRCTFYDIVFHPAVTGTAVPPLGNIPKDHYMEGIDGFTVRDGWESGSLFAAIIGGYNPQGGSHNQLDSGAFVYHNGGKMWFTDLGSDYYNTKSYFSNYALYRRNAEGNNVLSIRPLPFGQAFDTTGRIIRHEENGDIPFAIIDNTEVYGGYATKAYRGLRLENGRRTTVLQDEVHFAQPTDAFWVAHFESKIRTALSEDARRLMMTHEDGTTLCVRLLGDEQLHFEILDCYEFLLSGTEVVENEYTRDEYRRLVVRMTDVTDIRMAVSIELAANEGGYAERLPMENW